MATDFWASTHYKRWIVDRSTLKQARADDLLYVSEPEYVDFLSIYFANLITKLGKKLQFRQRVVATATVFFHRFYLKNSYCETDPYVVLSACCYVAAKAEESPVHIKNVVAESRALFSQEQYNVKHFPSDNHKLAEMEFYLVDDLDCDLIVFHPYRTLLALCKKDSSSSPASGSHSISPTDEAEAGELGTGIGIEDGPRYWGTGEGKLELSEGALQTAWFIINDTYRSELCLLYPPHLIAVTAIYLTLVLHTPTQNSIAHLLPYSSAFNSDSAISSESMQTTPQPRRSSRTSDPSSKQTQQDPISFLADLNVSLSTISTIAQEIISMYSLWSRYREDVSPEELRKTSMNLFGDGTSSGSPASHTSHAGQRSGSTPLGNTPGSIGGEGGDDTANSWPFGQGRLVTANFLSSLLNNMREARMNDMAHPPNGRPVVVNRMLERTG
ncbi:cyclin-like protein [Lentinula aciculospora]|uniref:Cyclin-like protein n=1 Tax=Lentinula aciculospora TaxID=153920 RepID=A0A9W9A5Y5_9AGAR|nr:cyclin-like protein [Lentinula aciculospora]